MHIGIVVTLVYFLVPRNLRIVFGGGTSDVTKIPPFDKGASFKKRVGHS